MLDTPGSPPRCDCCGGALATRYQAQVPLTGEIFRIARCGQCGLGHTLPQPEELSRYYGAQYHGGRHGMTDRMCMARRLGFVGQVAAPGRLLDFGCGKGGFLGAARTAGWEVVGVDMNPEIARAHGLTIVERAEEVTGPFDIITLWHSLEHLRSPRHSLEELLPLLRPGGHMVIAVPNWASLQARAFGPNWFHLDPPWHLFHFTPTALTQLLTERGLQIVRRWNLEAEIDLFGWAQSALNLVLSHRNVLRDLLTGPGQPHAAGEVIASLVLGSLVTAVCAPVVPFAAAAGRGGIMIVAARRPG